MEIRRLQHIKGGSFTLSLPKEWVEMRKLKRGEEIAVFDEEDGSLRLYPIKMEREEPAEVVLSLEDFPEVRALAYCIGTYYIQGINKISIASKKMIPADVKKRLKLLRMDLPGVEVAEERADAISFHAIVDPAAFLLESLIEKTSSFSLHLQEDAIKSIVSNDFQLANEVIERSKEALRHYRMTIRQVALASFSKAIARKVGVKDCRECVTFALIARDLNRLVYHSSSIAMQFLTLKGKAKISREILRIIEDISSIAHEMQSDSVQAFLKKDIMLAIATMGKMSDVRQQEKKLLKIILKRVKDADLAVTLSHIARDLRRIAGYSVAIADDAMNRALAPTP
ncbi:phosphate uptake regulator PhoU [Candidatus Bathyarchaeota archaeon]|nr:phosphate uptake regulator PhoU [Candidatus Bathyarchaeota archaeon]MCK4669053.1 phosphate uptake regulator PhoU [Candidatus Bathyarchaeota archaeon]